MTFVYEKETYVYEKDIQAYEKKLVLHDPVNRPTLWAGNSAEVRAKRDVHIWKRDLCIWEETYVYEDLCI